MSKLSLTDLTSLTNETSAVNTINSNNTKIENALELTLSRNGLTPNEMTTNLDMNSFRILNLPAPIDDNDAVRLIDVQDGIKGDKGDAGAPGGPLANGDYGDIVVTNSGTTISLDSAVVTAAARTVLDDLTIPDMRITLALGDAATKNTGTSAGTLTAGDDVRLYSYVINNQNADYQILLADSSTPTIIVHTSASPHNYTISAVTSQAHRVGAQVSVFNNTTGGVLTLLRGSSVNFLVNGATTSSNATIAAGGFLNAVHVATNTWLVTGTGVTV